MKRVLLSIFIFNVLFLATEISINAQTPKLTLKKFFPEKTLVAHITINDKLLVAGNKIFAITQPYDPDFKLSRTLYSYDIQDDEWEIIGDLPVIKNGFSTASVNGKLYIIGGTTPTGMTNSVEEYDTENNKWSVKSGMISERDCAGSIVLGNKIYIIGGSQPDGRPSCEVYNTLTDKWISLAEMPTIKSSWTTVVESNGIIYAIGAYQGIFEAYDTTTNTWTKKSTSLVPAGPLTAAAVNGKVYLFSSSNQNNLAAEYDPSLDTWIRRKIIPGIGRDCNLCVIDNEIYLIGGVTSSNALLSSVQKYNPQTNSWKLVGNMSQGKWYTGLVVFNNKIYIVGGYISSGGCDDAVEVFNPVTTSINKNELLPGSFNLQNYPNPFNPETVIRYQIPYEEAGYFSFPLHVEMKIYDILGNEISVPVNKDQTPGIYEVIFNASGLANGLYLCKLTAGNLIKVNKMLLIK